MTDHRHQFDRHDDVIDPEIEALIAELDAADFTTPPPPEIWAGIEARLADEMNGTVPTDTGVVDLARERAVRRSPGVLGVAAAVVLIVIGVVVTTVTGGQDDDVLAVAELVHDPAAFDPLGVDAVASVRLIEAEGALEIVVDSASLPEVDAEVDFELWLIETDETGTPIDIAPVALIGGAGVYPVPADLDVDTHRIVDISIEPRDGDETHSGRSILRGTLTET